MNKSTDITPTKGAARPLKKVAGVKETSAEKMARIPIKIIPQPSMRKPEWIRMKMPNSKRYQDIKQAFVDMRLFDGLNLLFQAHVTRFVLRT